MDTGATEDEAVSGEIKNNHSITDKYIEGITPVEYEEPRKGDWYFEVLLVSGRLHKHYFATKEQALATKKELTSRIYGG